MVMISAVMPRVIDTPYFDACKSSCFMPMIDIAPLLVDISADAHCGPDLEYSLDYVELARLMQGAPEVEYGGMHLEAVEPDWRSVETLASKLLGQTHDLRLAVYLTHALLARHGLAGLERGLCLTEGMLERYWPQLHPQLDRDDDNDPTARISILVALDEKSGMVRQMFNAALVRSPLHGCFSLRDIDLAEGELLPGAAETAPDIKAINTAFHETAYGELNELAITLMRACERIGRIETLLTEQVGHLRSVSLPVLRQLLRRASEVVQKRLADHPGRVLEVVQEEEEGAAGESGAVSGQVNHRDDVMRLLDRICEYYLRMEPGSPVPLLLQRARRMVTMSFFEIMEELSPASLNEVNQIAGIRVDG